MTGSQGFALAFLPTITISSWRGFLEFTVMTFVANSGTLRTTTQRPNESTRSTFKNILVDMFCTGPRERTSIVITQDMKRRVIRITTTREYHLGDGALLTLGIDGTVRVRRDGSRQKGSKLLDMLVRKLPT